MQLVYDKCKQLETEELKEYMNRKMEVLIRAQNEKSGTVRVLAGSM